MGQCAIPVFDGLIPEPHNSRILDLLFMFAHWHALAKLRLHTDLTLGILDQCTTLLGKFLRDFQSKTSSKFETKELPREMNARERRKKKAKKTTKKANDKKVSQKSAGMLSCHLSYNYQFLTTIATEDEDGKATEEDGKATPKKKPRRRRKTMNLNTYKVHSLGDYVEAIRRYGTTDSFSTERVR